MSKPYSASTNSEGLYYVDGFGQGLGYYAHTLYPELTCDTKEEAIRAAKIANIAFEAGRARMQNDIRKALGVGNDHDGR